VATSMIPRSSASRSTSEVQSLSPDNEDTSKRVFSPDLAFDLMNRLRDVLMISLSQGWQIFSERCAFLEGVLSVTPDIYILAARPKRSSEVAKSWIVQSRLLPSVAGGAVRALTQGACHLLKLNPNCFPNAFPFSSP
jgi:hypothetical protein